MKSGYTEGSLFTGGNLYYECRDKKTGMKFNQEFIKKGLFSKLIPFEDSGYGYIASLNKWNAENKL